MARVVVDVMPKPDILDPQGKAVTGALARLGFSGVSVRQGKRFELELEGDVTDARLDEVRKAAETLLANTVIETFAVRLEPQAEQSVDVEPRAKQSVDADPAERSADADPAEQPADAEVAEQPADAEAADQPADTSEGPDEAGSGESVDADADTSTEPAPGQAG
jgi:phosphoribosylformylglycinamidine synthase subunit PurS